MRLTFKLVDCPEVSDMSEFELLEDFEFYIQKRLVTEIEVPNAPGMNWLMESTRKAIDERLYAVRRELKVRLGLPL